MEEVTGEEWDTEDRRWEVGIMAAVVALGEVDTGEVDTEVDMEDEEGLGGDVECVLIW